jgi:hypothetical protein
MNYTVIRLVVFALYAEEKAVRLLRRRRIYPGDNVLSDIDVNLWRQSVSYLRLCSCLPWFIPRWLFPFLFFLPGELCVLFSRLGFLSHLDVLDREYYANSGHGTGSVDFIIRTVDSTFLPMGPPPLRRSCTGWYTTESENLDMTDAERAWLQEHNVTSFPKTRSA